MNENLNLTEILKECPKGIKLYSPIFGDVYLDKIRPYLAVIVTTNKEQDDFKEEFLYDGRYGISGECMLFPSKDQRDWSKWHRPFVDGDIVFYNDTIAIFKEWGDETLFRTHVTKYLCCDSLIDINTPLFGKGIRKEIRFATEKEKETLFQAIKSLGYKWNPETKTLEPLIVPKFKVGDRIREKGSYISGIIKCIDTDNFYKVEYSGGGVSFVNVKYQNKYELVPDKFDPKTLQPFDKVLVKDSIGIRWNIQFFEEMHEWDKNFPFKCVGGEIYSFCIPYNDDTKHLVGKLEDAPEFYRYWED